MEKKYISVDIESSGRTPGKYSMLSFGACVVGDISKQFYRELKPIGSGFTLEAMSVGCLGLKCLDELKNMPEYNPASNSFKPELALKVLDEKGETPAKAMHDFRDWIIEVSKDYRPVLAAKPTSFDAMFIIWYFDNFCNEESPLGFSAEDIGSMYRGHMNSTNASFNRLKVETNIRHTHNALDDATLQAIKFEKLLEMMKQAKKYGC